MADQIVYRTGPARENFLSILVAVIGAPESLNATFNIVWNDLLLVSCSLLYDRLIRHLRDFQPWFMDQSSGIQRHPVLFRRGRRKYR